MRPAHLFTHSVPKTFLQVFREWQLPSKNNSISLFNHKCRQRGQVIKSAVLIAHKPTGSRFKTFSISSSRCVLSKQNFLWLTVLASSFKFQ